MASPSRTRSRLLLPTLAFCQFLIAVDYNIVLVALPGLGRELDVMASGLTWVVSAYALAFGGLLLLGGRVSDVFGPRRTMLTGLALFAVGSAAATFAPSLGVVLAGRVVQGVGGAFLTPAVLAMIATSFAEGPARFRALSIWSAAGAMGLAGGSALGGILVAWARWRSVFALIGVLAVIALAAVVAAVRADDVRARSASTGGRLDVFGVALATSGVTAVVFALSRGAEVGWTSPDVVATGLGGGLLTVAFVLHQRRTAQPILPPSLFRRRALSVGAIAMILFIAPIGASYYTFTLLLQDVLGAGALVTGLAFLPWGVMAIAGSRLARALLDRFGLRSTMVVSLLVTAAGTAGFATSIRPGIGLLVPIAWTLLLGAGQAMTFAALFVAAGTGVPADLQGVASAVMSTAQQIGTALGLAVLIGVAVAIAGAAPTAAATAAGLTTATWVSSAVLIASAVLAGSALRRAPRADGIA